MANFVVVGNFDDQMVWEMMHEANIPLIIYHISLVEFDAVTTFRQWEVAVWVFVLSNSAV